MTQTDKNIKNHIKNILYDCAYDPPDSWDEGDWHLWVDETTDKIMNGLSNFQEQYSNVIKGSSK